MKDMKTSVIMKEPQYDEQCRESLKQFLTPTFVNMTNNQQKKIGKKLKTYAQVLGIPPNDNDSSAEKQTNKNQKQMQQKNRNYDSNEKEEELKQVIKGMKKQIDNLCSIVKTLCNTIAQNDTIKQSVENQLEDIVRKSDNNANIIISHQNSNKRSLENNKQNENNQNDMTQKNWKIKSHPNSKHKGTTGGIEKCVQWIKEFSNETSNKKSKLNE